jgi:hypothetical protein
MYNRLLNKLFDMNHNITFLLGCGIVYNDNKITNNPY